ncbi:MAG: hydroxyquinol 1,2-dioxygenase [Geminicoccus sp.]|nr:hydroxyquinol 1,2-dioxygenase [Geminicoccus sp.]
MRTVNQHNLTHVFSAYFGDETDPRVREIMTALAQHIHDFARDVKLTHAEWQTGIKFLQWAGEITTEERNEFVLLSDVLGLSSLVDMINTNPEATSSSVLGPFHVSNPPAMEMGDDLRGDFEGQLVLVQGKVTDTEGKSIPGAQIDIWQTAPNGLYSSQDPEQDTFSFHGLLTSDDAGFYRFTTVRPVSYTVPTDGPVGDILRAAGRHPWRPSHLHFIVKAEGCKPLVTEVFPTDDPYLDQDTVFGVREDLVMEYVERPASDFPDNLALSGKVREGFAQVDFDFVLAKE